MPVDEDAVSRLAPKRAGVAPTAEMVGQTTVPGGSRLVA